MTRWLLNSAVIAAGAYGTYCYTAATREDLAAFLRTPGVISRIGYLETAQMIEQWTSYHARFSRESSALAPGDVAFVVRLRYRVDPSRKGAPVATGEDAWEIGRLERLS